MTSASDLEIILQEADERKIGYDSRLRQLFEQIVVKWEEIDTRLHVEAVQHVHTLPFIKEATTEAEFATAEVHKVMKRFLNAAFIEKLFADSQELEVAELEVQFADCFGEHASVLTPALLHAFRASGRKILYTRASDIKKKARSRLRRKKEQKFEPAPMEPMFVYAEGSPVSVERLQSYEPMYIEVSEVCGSHVLMRSG